MKFIFALTVTSVLLSCRNNKVDTKSEEEQLMQLSREWSASAASENIEKTLSYWADDAVVMPPGQPPIKGKQAIKDMVAGTAKIPGFTISWEPLSAKVSEVATWPG